MANRIYPAALPNPCTPLGHDGSDFRALKQDITANTCPALRTSFPCDRNQTTKFVTCSVAAGAHVWTERVTYTIPSGKKALLMMIQSYFGVVPASSEADFRVEINGVLVIMRAIISTTLLDRLFESWPCALWLIAGDIVSVDTYNGSATAISFVINCLLSVFDA